METVSPMQRKSKNGTIGHMDEDFKSLRAKIDDIDSKILDALVARMDVVRKIGHLKNEQGLAVRDDARWNNVMSQVHDAAISKGLSAALVDEIYAAIHNAALEIETKGA